MYHLRGEGGKGDNRVLFPYGNINPFSKGQSAKLVDLLIRPVEDPYNISLQASATGIVGGPCVLKGLFEEEFTVEKLVKKIVFQIGRSRRKWKPFKNKPGLTFRKQEQKFVLTLPPQSRAVVKESALLFGLLGFGPEQNVTELGEDVYGIVNMTDEKMVISAQEEMPEGAIVKDLNMMIETASSFEQRHWDANPDGNFNLFFQRDMRDVEFPLITKKLENLEGIDQVVTLWRKMLGTLVEQLDLEQNSFLVKKIDQKIEIGLLPSIPTDFKLKLVLNEAFSRLLNANSVINFDFSDVEEDSSGEKIYVGPLQEIAQNLLDKMVPLLICNSTITAGSYITGVGPAGTLAFISADGEIFPQPVPLDELSGTLEMSFYRRDLTPLLFETDVEMIAHLKEN